MPALPTWREVGSASGKMVLFDFTRRACLVIIQSQLVLLSRSSEIHVCMIKTVVCIWSEGQGWSSCMSSGKDWLETEWISINEQRGVEYRMKRIGPRTKPSATPNKNPQVLNSAHWQSQSESYQWGKTQTMKEWRQKCHRLKSVEENMVVFSWYYQKQKTDQDTSPPSRASRISLVLLNSHLSAATWMVCRLGRAEQVMGIKVGKELPHNYSQWLEGRKGLRLYNSS